MTPERVARLVPALRVGAELDPDAAAALPPGVRLHDGRTLGLGSAGILPDPYSSIVLLPRRARYAGEPLAVVTAESWAVADDWLLQLLRAQGVPQADAASEPRDPEALPHAIADDEYLVDAARQDADPDLPKNRPLDEALLSPVGLDDAPDDEPDAGIGAEEGAIEPTEQEVVGNYQVRLQLAVPDTPLWAHARADRPDGSVDVELITQWPELVRDAIVAALRTRRQLVRVRARPTDGSRDAALWASALLAVLAAGVSREESCSLRLSMRADQRHTLGGRSPAWVSWSSRVLPDGSLMGNEVQVHMDLGAYPTLLEETQRRARRSVESLYRSHQLSYDLRLHASAAPPLGLMEGVGTAQLTFAREVHYNRLAELAGEDPIVWRQRHARADWPVLHELLASLGSEADFHRRYSANELVRKRRVQLPRYSSKLKGIGCAMGEQISGLTGEKETGAVTVRLEPGGSAVLLCSLPTPTPRLALAWRQLVASELALDIEKVRLVSDGEADEVPDSGPRIFSRGVSIVSRTIQSVCQAIQKQRFRDPLPLQIRRSIRTSRAARTPAYALRSAGAAAVEVLLLPGSMEVEIASVTLAVYAGRILDRGMAEAELRRGIYQALTWSLHEAIEDPEAMPPIGPVGYDTSYRGRPPRIRIVFGTAIRRDGPTGIGDIPFLTIPAALTSALSQASGLYLDTLPTRPAALLRMLQED